MWVPFGVTECAVCKSADLQFTHTESEEAAFKLNGHSISVNSKPHIRQTYHVECLKCAHVWLIISKGLRPKSPVMQVVGEDTYAS